MMEWPTAGFVVLSPDGLADDCARAALIVTARPVASTCGGGQIPMPRL
jgi:hypothetical protein